MAGRFSVQLGDSQKRVCQEIQKFTDSQWAVGFDAASVEDKKKKTPFGPWLSPFCQTDACSDTLFFVGPNQKAECHVFHPSPTWHGPLPHVSVNLISKTFSLSNFAFSTWFCLSRPIHPADSKPSDSFLSQIFILGRKALTRRPVHTFHNVPATSAPTHVSLSSPVELPLPRQRVVAFVAQSSGIYSP